MTTGSYRGEDQGREVGGHAPRERRGEPQG